ncbi:Acyl-CoA synthetase (AMP-forming)/AMP-acid ligase II [Hoeflea phototrophica DFL-43]|uniref:Acyl-CoA synthetase (AMP-forming)/AMP-acid ligase II n=1 Tax=Hoeflea phototrophica (strain DSM 17068 / NCIMB 14078 / DFL-43) TaxID=411684 RepID=A9CZM7_HOEPD|nr:AMP-binding protein [Hoeflea phototrophica]EDQ34799.1 Acyl-CoA synthetase (AMP-forming)/AMP-acid ligase II [Hoeflea phototrophica DFL-43]
MTTQVALRRELHYGNRVVACHAERPRNVHAMLASAVARHPRRQALICGETRLSYAELDDEVGRVAAGLAALGVGQGDRVAMLLGNGVPFVVVTYAAARLGAVTVPLSIREQMPGIRHALLNSEAIALIVEAEFIDLVPPPDETPNLSSRIAVGQASGYLDYDRLRRTGPLADAADVSEDEVATILYTSGTTGVPKGAMLTGLGIVHSSINFVTTMDLGPTDKTIVVVPMNHVTGLVAGIHTLICAGGSIAIMRDFKAERFLECAAREGMTCSLMVPAMYNLCLLQANLSDYDLSAWRVGGYGGAPMPAATIERLADALPGLGLMNAYGATEVTSPATVMPSDQTAARRLSVGLPVPGAEICVMDEAGREVPAGVDGELWIRGAMVVPGYWRNPEADAREFSAGFWKSGDIGSVDEDGFVHVHDRKKDMINRGGYKVFTAQVESVLTACPGVIEAAVVAKPCPILGERVHAVLSVNQDEAKQEAVSAQCAAQLADYQCPESYTFYQAPLPRNANGKILKRQIRQELGFLDP